MPQPAHLTKAVLNRNQDKLLQGVASDRRRHWAEAIGELGFAITGFGLRYTEGTANPAPGDSNSVIIHANCPTILGKSKPAVELPELTLRIPPNRRAISQMS